MCFCVPEFQEIREEVVWDVLEAEAWGKDVKKGGETMNAPFHPAAPCTIPAQAENMFKTHLSHRCNEAKIGDFSMC